MHLIQQHKVNISCRQEAFGYRLKNELADVFKQGFYPKLNILLNQFDSKDKIIEIKSLPVNIALSDLDNWKSEIVEQCLHGIEEYLNSNISKHEDQQKDMLKLLRTSTISSHRYIQNLLIVYLKTGSIMNNPMLTSLTKLYDLLVVDKEFANQLELAFDIDSKILLRWSLQVPHSIKQAFLKIHSKSDGFRFIEALNDKTKLELVANEKQFLEYLYWLSIKAKKNRHTRSELCDILDQANTYFNLDKSLFLKKVLLDDVLNQIQIPSALKDLCEQLQEENGEGIDDKMNTLKTEKENLVIKHGKRNLQYVSNAGLLILHPFLFTLFQQLDFLDEKDWKNMRFQHRAVLITQYLTNFEEQVFENELMFNKLLCGVAIDFPIDTDWEISKNEKEKCHQLLDSVIEHWSVLKSTSASTLQESFIRRKGKLEQKANGSYELTVEQASIDMLLDQLPWGIGTLKTPWMETYMTSIWN